MSKAIKLGDKMRVIPIGDGAKCVTVRKATGGDFDGIIALLDGEFTKEGFGFVNRAQVQTEVGRGSVWVADDAGEIVGVRIGLGTLWNVAVAKAYRGRGIGKQLVEVHRPAKIRVKCEPVGHLSKAQRELFTDPRPFYESLGFRFWCKARSRNFWQNADGKAVFHKEGKKAHIHVYVDPRDMLFMLDESDAEGDRNGRERRAH